MFRVMETALFAILIGVLAFSSAFAGRIEVTIENIDPDKGGAIMIGVYDDTGFPEQGEQSYGKSVEVDGPKVKLTFEEIPAGTYAIACYHDVNGDEKINRSFFGVPKEPYGFSNNKFRRFGPPDFEDAAFEVEEGQTVKLRIKLKG